MGRPLVRPSYAASSLVVDRVPLRGDVLDVLLRLVLPRM